ncbi:MAG: hypothetical protein H8E16_00420 [Flavobacteriales bacterium]|nr:hypothetical protein [Flavobacteriales bacterium]
MNKHYNHIIFSFVFLLSTSLNAQSIVKIVSGNVYEVVKNEKKKIRGINRVVDNSNTLLFDNNSYIIVDINGVTSMISAEDYSSGIKLINFKPNSESNDDGFWTSVLSSVMGNSFADKQKIDGLYISQFQGTSRGIFDEPLKNFKVLPHYKSKIEWDSGNKLEVKFNGLNILEKETDDYIYVDKQVLNVCKPCTLSVDDIDGGNIDVLILKKEEEVFLESLFSNIDSGKDVELSQFCVIQLLISNELYMNANYFRDEFSDNKLIKNYLNNINLF